MRLGGLGLRSARRLTSCVLGFVAMPILQERVPEATATITREMAILRGCLGELHTACGILDCEGFVGRPTWEELLAGARPPKPEPQTVANGSMAGSTTHLPHLNTISGRT